MMIGNIKNANSENPLSDVLKKSGKDRTVSTDDSGFLAMLRDNVDYSSNQMLKNDSNSNQEAGLTTQSLLKQERNNTGDKTFQNVTSNNDAASEYKESPKVETSAKKETLTEQVAEKKIPESTGSRTEAGKKADETRESLKEKKSLTDTKFHEIAGSLIKKFAEKNKLQEKSGIRETGEKLVKNSAINDNRKTFSKVPYPGEARRANLQHDNHGKVSAELPAGNAKDISGAQVKELGRNIQAGKKTGELKASMNGNFRETDLVISAGLKKDKPKETRADGARHGATDEARNEKRHAGIPENIQLKQKDAAGEGFSGKGAGNGADQGQKDGNLQTAGRTETANRTASERTEQLKNMPEFRQSLQEIMDKAKVTVKDSQNGSFTVKLFPKDLGNVNVNLVLENGVVNGKFLVDSIDAKNLLLSSLDNLRDQLAESGISVGEFSVNVRDEREKFFHDKEENSGFNHGLNNSKENITAAVVYDNSSLPAHNGSINMII